MKRKQILLAGAAYLALGISAALAQTNTSTVTQGGTGNSATIDQTGNTGGTDTSTVNQAGTDGVANVTQSGAASNTATVNQDDTLTNTGYQNAQITQTGTAGSNTAIVNQGGSNPIAVVNQTSTGTGNNYASVDQANHANEGSSDWVEGLVNQTGTDNSATITQLQSYVQLTSAPDGQINQNGIGNTAILYQDTASSRPLSSINQSGYYNWANTSQFGSNDVASITQTGTVNGNAPAYGGDFATIYQDYASSNDDASVTENGVRNLFNIYQSGTNSNASITQSGNNPAYSYAYINQYANGGNATIVQTGTDNGFYLGLNNNVYWTGITQNGNDDTAFINETGNGNNSTINQNTNDGGAGGSNYAVSYQGCSSGDCSFNTNSSFSLISQDGSNNSAFVDQYGNNLKSTVTQTGNLGYVDVYQSVDGSSSTVTQGGTSNSATVWQYVMGGTSTVIQTGTSNTVFVKQ